MFDVFFNKATELNAARRPFALAIVVRHEKPISGKPGDKAIILADGSLYGWIGGGCTKPLIIQEAQKALADGQSRLVRIAPSSNASANGIIAYKMTCHSGGSLDIYIEPVLPKPQLVIFGRTELAQTLARLGTVMNYQITVVAPDADAALFPDADHLQHEIDLAEVPLAQPTFAIVATQGEHDAEALAETLAHDLPYVAFVASRKKAERTLAYLAEADVPSERLARVKTPAGLDIGARLPEEIAVSVLAEIIAVMRREDTPVPPEQAPITIDRAVETLHLGGMSCAHCVLTVRNTLEALDHVTVHEVEIGTAQVSYNPADVDREEIVAALEKRGYPVLVEA